MSSGLALFAERYWGGDLRAAGAGLHVALAPAELLFRTVVALRATAYDHALLRIERAPIPVISIGNIAVGGAGKTPFTQWVARTLSERGHKPAIVHGGYADDEPELHRRWSPDIAVIVDRDRARAARTAATAGADVVVLDDAFQHRRLHRDLDIVLVSAERFGGGFRMLPRGPWREPIAALRRADLVMVTRKAATPDAAEIVANALAQRTGKAVVRVHLRADAWVHLDTTAQAPAAPALLVSALADPHSFHESVRQTGVMIAGTMSFADHHAYSAADANTINRRAAGAPIITTEKDWTKLDRLLDANQVWMLTQSVVIEQGADLLDDALAKVMS